MAGANLDREWFVVGPYEENGLYSVGYQATEPEPEVGYDGTQCVHEGHNGSFGVLPESVARQIVSLHNHDLKAAEEEKIMAVKPEAASQPDRISSPGKSKLRAKYEEQLFADGLSVDQLAKELRSRRKVETSKKEVHKITLIVVDHSRLGAAGVRQHLQNAVFPNDCIICQLVVDVETKEVDWADDHPLNSNAGREDAARRLFKLD